MAEGRNRHHWTHTAAVCCLIANANRDTKRRRKAFQLSDFNPYGSEMRQPPPKNSSIRVLKSLFVADGAVNN